MFIRKDKITKRCNMYHQYHNDLLITSSTRRTGLYSTESRLVFADLYDRLFFIQ